MIRRRSDRGSAGVWLLGLCSVLALAATVAVLVGSALVTRHKAIAAADLSALAAAVKAVEGEESACSAAADIAVSMGAQLAACSLSGMVADVTVTVTADLGVVGRATARASARAGPADYTAPQAMPDPSHCRGRDRRAQASPGRSLEDSRWSTRSEICVSVDTSSAVSRSMKCCRTEAT